MSDPEAPVEEVEPNDTRVTAGFLPLTEDPVGSGYSVGWGLGRQDPGSFDDPDYWRVELLACDIVSVSVGTPASGANPYIELHNGADQHVAGDADGGPFDDAFISHYVVPVSGSYYVLVYDESSTTGSYELRVDRARGIQLETDGFNLNDTIGNANALTLTRVGTHQLATVGGTVMGPEGSNTDEDVFSLGVFNAGNIVELTARLPGSSTLGAKVTLLNAANHPISLEPLLL